jgi:hypothetical protein
VHKPLPPKWTNDPFPRATLTGTGGAKEERKKMLPKRTGKYIARTTLGRRLGASVEATPPESKMNAIKFILNQECFD